MSDFLFHDLPSQIVIEEDLKDILEHTKRIGASDIYIKALRPVKARIDGVLHNITHRYLEIHEVEACMSFIYGANNGPVQVRLKPISKAYSFRSKNEQTGLQERLRYRCQATGTYFDGGFTIAIVLRELPAKPRKLDKESLGAIYESLFPEVGMVLICGETGSGKSTLMSGIVRDIIEADQSKHIIEYSQPIEYVYDEILEGTEHVEVDQSEVPEHLPDFPSAIADSLRRDPDIIMIGEMRDEATIKAALLAAQTGHTVYSTLHVNSAAGVFLRILQSLSDGSASMILGGLIDSIRTIVCQDLLPKIGGGRIPVREFISFDRGMRDQLMAAAQSDIKTVPLVVGQMVNQRGMSKLDSVRELVSQGLVESHWIAIYQRDYE